MKVGDIVKADGCDFFAKIIGEWQIGYQLTGFSKTGITPNRVYYESDLTPITDEEIETPNTHDKICLEILKNKM